MLIPLITGFLSRLGVINRQPAAAHPQSRNVADFLTDLQTIAPAAGRGSYAFVNPAGSYRGYVQFIIRSQRLIEIHRLWTHEPGQGNGSIMIKALCNLADRHDVQLSLKVVPIGRKPFPLAREDLKKWYERYGFAGEKWKLLRQPVAVPSNT